MPKKSFKGVHSGVITWPTVVTAQVTWHLSELHFVIRGWKLDLVSLNYFVCAVSWNYLQVSVFMSSKTTKLYSDFSFKNVRKWNVSLQLHVDMNPDLLSSDVLLRALFLAGFRLCESLPVFSSHVVHVGECFVSAECWQLHRGSVANRGGNY